MTIGGIDTTSELAAARYQLQRPLGEGGTGAVFLALDRETGEEVALKKLLRMDQSSVSRLKREFRALANLHHPNLVKLYDLQRADDAWFLTMEFVDGKDLRSSLLGERDQHATRHDSNRIPRIASAFHQLALGVCALHEAGMLHRDLKPSNVVISKTGRVVLLDFGLVRELGMPLNPVTLDGAVAGTPAYMPPEQALGLDLNEASDWYAFGVMLYEVLSGALPITGNNPIQLVQRKLKQDAPPLERDAAPRALAELCMALIQREPKERPAAAAILGVLAELCVETSEHSSTYTEELTIRTGTSALHARAPLFGRDAELDQLHEALQCARENQSAVAHVRGTSGSGKSSLIEHFLDQVQDGEGMYTGEVVVLRSRCYEREAMPFKAFDGVIDALVAHLASLDDFELAHALPSEIHALTQVFPIFERLRSVQRLLATGGRQRGEASQLRRHAEQALRELFTNVARRRPLVVWIDDLQWGDLDSTSMIQDWLKRPAEVPILLVLSYRSEEIQTSSCLRVLIAPPSAAPSAVPQFQLELGPLRDSDVEQLCGRRLGTTSVPSATLIARIVSESQGNPFLALQLAALAQAKLDRGEADFDALSVGELVLRTSALLPEPARNLLSVLAIAGRPMVPQFALGAADVQREGRSHIHALQGLRLVRTRIVDGVRLLEVYHDRVREAVQSSLTAAQTQHIHGRLLRVLEAGGQSDPSWLHELAVGAGQSMLALRYGQLAAQIASSSLAFERAAELYARCLTLTDAPNDLSILWVKLGSALARCRRGARAADAYLKASEYATEAERLPLLQLAASHLLRSGRYEQGEELVKRLMHAQRIELPTTTAGHYAAIAWERTRFSLIAGAVKPRAGVPMPPEVLHLAEFYGLVAIETQAYAPLRAALFQARTLRMAYQYGESTTMARALCLTATLSCLSGTVAAAARSDEQLQLAERWLDEAKNPNLRVELLSARAVCAMLLGKIRDVIEPSYSAEELYETKSTGGDTGDYYYMFAVRTVRIGSLQNLGRHVIAIEELRDLLTIARETDNLTAILQMTLCVTAMEQVLERCAGTRVRLDQERSQLPHGTTGILHVLHMASAMRAAAMTGEFDWAQTLVDEFWGGYEASPVRRSAYLAYLLHVNHSRMRLNRSVVHGEAGDPESLIRRDLRWLSNKAPVPLRAPARARLRARLAYLRGDKAAAVELFRESITEHTTLGAMDDVAREKYALACLTDGNEGAQAKVAALTALLALGYPEPEADVRGYYPELFREAAK